MYMHKADLAKGFLKGAEKCWKWGRRRLVPETGYLATERNAQSNLRALGREWGSPAEQWWENLERSGKPENIPAVGDPLQVHFCGEASSAEARDSPRPERGFGGCRTCSPAPRGRGAPRVSAAARRGCARRLLGTARLGSRRPALAARPCPRCLQLPETQQQQQNISLYFCR